MALVVLTSAALTGVSGLVLPAYGQSAGVGNTGQASANSGGNSSVGNASGNAVASQSTETADPGLLNLGGLLDISLGIGSQGTNTSNGTSAVSTGPAAATGNTTTNGVTQAGSGGAVAPIFGPILPLQSAGVSNSGLAAADTGGNRSVGNDSDNAVTANQTVSAGLISIGVNVASLTNNSNGTSTIQTGAAQATGNEAVNSVDQVRTGSGFGGIFGPGVCEGFRGRQIAEVENAGSARADTGGNASVGNQSNNVVSSTQNTSGALINLPINLSLGSALANTSDGQSAITTGPATATGNQATTGITQQCLQPTALADKGGPLHFGPSHLKLVDGRPVHHGASQFQLARTGVDPFVMGLVAFTLLFGGFLFLVWERVEALPAGRATAS